MTNSEQIKRELGFGLGNHSRNRENWTVQAAAPRATPAGARHGSGAPAAPAGAGSSPAHACRTRPC